MHASVRVAEWPAHAPTAHVVAHGFARKFERNTGLMQRGVTIFLSVCFMQRTNSLVAMSQGLHRLQLWTFTHRTLHIKRNLNKRQSLLLFLTCLLITAFHSGLCHICTLLLRPVFIPLVLLICKCVGQIACSFVIMTEPGNVRQNR